jgi:hypothetical protein
MISVPANGEAGLRAGRPTVKKNMSVPHTTAVLTVAAPICWNTSSRLSLSDLDQLPILQAP